MANPIAVRAKETGAALPVDFSDSTRAVAGAADSLKTIAGGEVYAPPLRVVVSRFFMG